MSYAIRTSSGELYHHGILGQKWGVRRYQNPDGSLTAVGKKRLVKSGISEEEYEKARKNSIKTYRDMENHDQKIRKNSRAGLGISSSDANRQRKLINESEKADEAFNAMSRKVIPKSAYFIDSEKGQKYIRTAARVATIAGMAATRFALASIAGNAAVFNSLGASAVHEVLIHNPYVSALKPMSDMIVKPSLEAKPHASSINPLYR